VSGNRLSWKGRTLAAVLLFIGTALSPVVISHLVSATPEKTFVDVTIEACGVTGYRPYTVSLARPQYDRLVRYLDWMMMQLNQTKSQKEILLLFYEAVEEMNMFGLLPRGMSVSQAQLLVRGGNINPHFNLKSEHPFVTAWGKKLDDILDVNIRNSFCVLYAAATKIPGYSPEPIIIPLGLLLVIGLLPALIVSAFGQAELANQLAALGISLWMSNPLRWFNFVIFEGYDIEFRSLGLKGLVHETLIESGVFWGFTGLMLSGFNNTTYFLGFTLRIYGPSF